MKKNFTPIFLKSFLIAMIIIPVFGYSGEIKTGSSKTAVVFGRSDYQHVPVAADLSEIQFRDVQTKDGLFTELFVSGFGYSNVPGEPKLPVYKKLIEVPAGASYQINIINQTYEEFDLASYGIMNKIIPAQPPVSKNSNPDDLPFVYNADLYSQNQWLGNPVVTVSNVGTQRSVRIARMEISPVQYNPITNKIRVCTSLDYSVTFTGADVVGTITYKKERWSPYFTALFSQLPNYKEETDALITSSPVTYVVVSSPLFKTALQPFITWKKKKGFQVIEAYTDNPAVGTTTASIKTYLTDLYNNPPAGFEKPSFILFVGDVAQIPAFTDDGHPSDLKYCDYTNDHLPEVFYGRFSATNLTQLQPYIDKTLEYEQYTMPSDAFLGEVTMVAGADASHQLTWGNGQINYGTTYYFNTAHNILSHTYLQPEPPAGNYSVNIRQNVSDGVGYANYTAHGSEQGWADPEFLINQIPPLANAHEYCLMVGNCCLTSKYNVNCFAEEITRASGKGALGYIGCSDYSYWDEDYFWGCGFKSVVSNPVYNPDHLGAYDVTFHDQGNPTSEWFVTQGQMVQGGNYAVEESNSGMKLYYWQAYNLMGDPSVSVYFSVPPALTATYPTTLLVGVNSLQIVTEPYAYAGLTVHDTVLIAAQCADSTGIINFTFASLSSPDSLSVVITKQNRKPHIGSISVIPATGPYVVLNSTVVNDSAYGNNDNKADFSEKISLDVSVKNIGVMNSGNIVGTISTADTNVTILNNSCTFGVVNAGTVISANNVYSIQIKNDVPDQHQTVINLELNDGTNTWNSEMRIVLNAPVVSVSTLTVTDPAPGGNGNGVLDPGENATLKIRVSNTGHSVTGNAISHLTVASASAPWIIVTNPDNYIGTFTPGSNYDVLFNVVVNGVTPAGTVADFSNTVTAGPQSQFEGSKDFQAPIGQLPYYVMSNTTINTCGGRFYDSGGPDNNYQDNEDFTTTFTTSTVGAALHAVFTSFDVEPNTTCNYDWLKIFNGPSTSSPLLGTYCGTTPPPDVTASSGSITFQFKSDYSENKAGWDVEISCTGGALGLSASAFPSNVCAGNSSQLVAMPVGGSGNYTYLWTPSTYLDDPTSKTPVCTPQGNISYTVTVNDGTSSLTSSAVQINVVPVPETPVITLNGDVLQSSAATGNQWYLNGAMIAGANQPTLVPIASGDYTVVVINSDNGCPSEPSSIFTYLMTGIGVDKSAESFVIYPNPSKGDFTVTFDLPSSGKYNISIMDGSGRVVKTFYGISGNAGSNKFTVEAADLPAGAYFVNLNTNSYHSVNKLILSK